MSGVLYKCRDYGPLAEPYPELVEEMFDKGKIHIDILEEGAHVIFI